MYQALIEALARDSQLTPDEEHAANEAFLEAEGDRTARQCLA